MKIKKIGVFDECLQSIICYIQDNKPLLSELEQYVKYLLKEKVACATNEIIIEFIDLSKCYLEAYWHTIFLTYKIDEAGLND